MPLSFGIGKSRGSEFDSAVFDCNYLQFYWWWTDGKDFDVRSEFLKPTQSSRTSSRNKQTTTYYRWWWIYHLYEMGRR